MPGREKKVKGNTRRQMNVYERLLKRGKAGGTCRSREKLTDKRVVSIMAQHTERGGGRIRAPKVLGFGRWPHATRCGGESTVKGRGA